MAVYPLLLAGLLVGVGWALRRRSVLTVRADEHADVVALHRHISRWRLAGLVGAVVLVVALVVDRPHLSLVGDRVGDLGRTAAVVPALAGLCLLLGTLVGELTARPATSALRTATVDTRRVRDVLPGALTLTTAVGTCILTALLVAGSVAGSPDDLGRPGRSLTVSCPRPLGPKDAGWLASSSTGPWPGSFYAVPIGVGLCLALVSAGVALAVIVRRPRPSATAAELDTALRRHAGRSVILALGVAVFGTLGPVAGLMGDALGSNDCRAAWLVVPAWGLGLLAVVAAGAAAWCISSVLVNPVLRVRASGTTDRVGQGAAGAGS